MTTTTNRPTSSSSTQFSTRRKTNTPRQSSRPSIRTPGYTWSPSSTYPPPLFGENSGSGLITATRAIGQFLGAAITVNIFLLWKNFSPSRFSYLTVIKQFNYTYKNLKFVSYSVTVNYKLISFFLRCLFISLLYTFIRLD